MFVGISLVQILAKLSAVRRGDSLIQQIQHSEKMWSPDPIHFNAHLDRGKYLVIISVNPDNFGDASQD